MPNLLNSLDSEYNYIMTTNKESSTSKSMDQPLMSASTHEPGSCTAMTPETDVAPWPSKKRRLNCDHLDASELRIIAASIADPASPQVAYCDARITSQEAHAHFIDQYNGDNNVELSTADDYAELGGARASSIHDEEQQSIFSAVLDHDFNERLRALQNLIPNGLQLEMDEILRVAVDYVKALEREIQTFDLSMSLHAWPASPSTEAAAGSKNLMGAGLDQQHYTSLTTTVSPPPPATLEAFSSNSLQKRGLCIVPLSALAKAF